jgi:hypothetical protein
MAMLSGLRLGNEIFFCNCTYAMLAIKKKFSIGLSTLLQVESLTAVPFFMLDLLVFLKNDDVQFISN